MTIAPRSTLTRRGNTYEGPIYGSNRTDYVCKQMTDVKLWLFFAQSAGAVEYTDSISADK